MDTCEECARDIPGADFCSGCNRIICPMCDESHDCNPALAYDYDPGMPIEQKLDKIFGISE